MQMTVALARSLVKVGRCDPACAAAAYLEDFDVRRGYAGGAHKVFAALKRGTPWHETGTMFFPEGSFGNGAQPDSVVFTAALPWNAL